MKAWSWFVVTPLVAGAAYWASPILVSSLTSHTASAVTIAQLDLPVDEAKPADKVADAAKQDIDYSSFGSLEKSSPKMISKVKPPVEFALQSVLMTGGDAIAVVDGNLVHQGDQVGSGYRVVKIEPEAVWLAIRRITNVKVGKKVKQESRDELKVLHFPEYRDLDMDADARSAANVPSLPTQTAAASGQTAGQMELEKDYKQILEKLKL
ncbi:MAG: hypothetical protein WDM70_10685 [Nitrosomonadales bacterium]